MPTAALIIFMHNQTWSQKLSSLICMASRGLRLRSAKFMRSICNHT
jgi:hypothetical protein